MVRFSADETEIVALISRMTCRRRRRGSSALERGCARLLVPLEAEKRDDLRFRRTATPLINRIKAADGPILWGAFAGSDASPFDRKSLPVDVRGVRDTHTGRLKVDAEAAGLVVLQFGPPTGAGRRREALLLASDHVMAPSEKIPFDSKASRADIAAYGRDMVERCARRLRRRGEWQDGRWFVASPEPIG